MKQSSIGGGALAIAILVFGQPVVTAQSYVVTQIGDGYMATQGSQWDLNESGQVVGMSATNGVGRGFLWSPVTPNSSIGTLAYLPLVNGTTYAGPHGVNNQGIVCGTAGGNNLPRSVIWPTAGNPQVLGGGGAEQQEGMALNDFGDVAIFRGGKPQNHGAYINRIVNGKRKLTFLGAGWPCAVNNSRQVLGYYAGSNGQSGVPLWSPNPGLTEWTRLLIVANGRGHDLNNNGQAVGSMNIAGNPHWQPFVYLPVPDMGMPSGANNLMSMVVAGLQAPADPNSQWVGGTATAISDNGTICGTAYAGHWAGAVWQTTESTSWIWDEQNGLRDFRALLQGTGIALEGPDRVNSAGQVVARSTDGTFVSGVLLTPQ